MYIIEARKFTYLLSALLVLASLISLFVYGLRLGIDFTGGSILEVRYEQTLPDSRALQEKVNALGFGQSVLQPTDDNGLLVRTRDLSEEEHQMLIQTLSSEGNLTELRFDSIGPTIGKELRNRSLWATLLVLLMIILYITWAFREVSKPVSSWVYGTTAIVALFHDLIIPLGIFSLLGHFKGAEIDTLFVTAILTVLGFSVHDTIVVFDRVRENLRRRTAALSFEKIVGNSLSQTLTRSINTSITVLLVLLALYFLGAESTKYFALTLIIGIIAGTYSSIFIATPLLVTWNNWRNR